MAIVPLVSMGALVFTIVNTLRAATNKLWSSIVTQVAAWGAGIVVATLTAASELGDTLAVGEQTLHTLNGPAVALLGMAAASIFGVIHELKQAFDDHDSAVQPPLIPPTSDN